MKMANHQTGHINYRLHIIISTRPTQLVAVTQLQESEPIVMTKNPRHITRLS
jgi:uncharacterized protein YqiB (DUF1249 family)